MEIIETPSDKAISSEPTLNESLFKLKSMTEITTENSLQVISAISNSEITPELVKAVIDIPDIQKASISIRTTLTQLPFYTELIKTNDEVKKALNALIVNIGLIAEYCINNPENKPPYTKGDDKSGWDLEQYQIEEFKKALDPATLEKTQKILIDPSSFESLKGNTPFEYIVVALAYQKVAMAENSNKS